MNSLVFGTPIERQTLRETSFAATSRAKNTHFWNVESSCTNMFQCSKILLRTTACQMTRSKSMEEGARSLESTQRRETATHNPHPASRIQLCELCPLASWRALPSARDKLPGSFVLRPTRVPRKYKPTFPASERQNSPILCAFLWDPFRRTIRNPNQSNHLHRMTWDSRKAKRQNQRSHQPSAPNPEPCTLNPSQLAQFTIPGIF